MSAAGMFDLNRLHAAGLVRTIDYQTSIGSTSDRAIELAARGDVDLPLLVVTDEQTAGRGRGANRWLSSAGALTFSLALEAPADRLPPARWPQVALVAGLAVCRALAEAAPRLDLRVKWPNDVYASGRKVCGILSESVPGWRGRLVVGIGVNVNNRFDEAGGENWPASRGAGRGEPMSLLEADGISRDLTGLLLGVLDQFDVVWSCLLESRQEELLPAYRERCFLTGKTVTLADANGGRTTGMCQGIDSQGCLVLLTEMGRRALASGTIVSWEG